MKIARNIAHTSCRRYRVTLVRTYLPNRLSSYHLTLEEAIAARDALEKKHPIRTAHYHPARPRCPHCGQGYRPN